MWPHSGHNNSSDPSKDTNSKYPIFEEINPGADSTTRASRKGTSQQPNNRLLSTNLPTTPEMVNSVATAQF